MNNLQVLALGGFILAGAHYIREGASLFEFGLIVLGCVFLGLSDLLKN